MSAQTKPAKLPPLDLSKWRKVPVLFMVVGGALALLGGIINHQQFATCWLLAFMFCLSICLGALFLVLAHHLFDAGWSVPIRRVCEHIARLLFPWILVLWAPVGIFAYTSKLYPWINQWKTSTAAGDHSLMAKFPLFTITGFYIASVGIFVVWG